LHCAYHAQFGGGATPKFLLYVLDMLGESVPLMKNIWGFDRDKALDGDLKARETIQRALDTKQ
jgi:hypothetical protein